MWEKIVTTAKGIDIDSTRKMSMLKPSGLKAPTKISKPGSTLLKASAAAVPGNDNQHFNILFNHVLKK